MSSGKIHDKFTLDLSLPIFIILLWTGYYFYPKWENIFIYGSFIQWGIQLQRIMTPDLDINHPNLLIFWSNKK